MNEARRPWIDLFEREGWFRLGRPNVASDLKDVGISYLGGEKNILGLQYVVDATEDFLIFEYAYEAPPIDMPDREENESGTTCIWVPWSGIEYAFRTRLKPKP